MKLRTFLKRHLLWVGFFAVLVPLLSILLLQYWSLLKLEKTSSVADKVWMKNYLSDVSKEVKFYYYSNAEQTLNTPASSLLGEDIYRAKHLFGKCEVVGAKLLFVTRFEGKEHPEILFYDPRSKTPIVNPSPAELRAANIAVAPLKLLSQEGSELRPASLSSDERDPENRVIIKPITNDAHKVVGASGMILDTAYFKNVYLPVAIHNSLAKFFPDNAQENVIVTVYDGDGKLVMATQPARGQDNESIMGLPYFGDWRLGIRSRHMTPEQWARWNFNLSMSLSLLMAVAVMCGIILALRTASREMKLSEMKTDFVSNVSHELRTPLSSIRVFGEFLRLGRVKEDEKMREYGEYIETESRRLTQLINNILDFSKIESDRKTYHFERANVWEVICATLKTFEVQLKQQGFTINFENPQAQLPPVLIDTDAIAQAFMNLLDNAVKYSGSSREIIVRLGQDEGFVSFAVADQGIGISRDEQKKIFDKFYRVSTGLVHDVKGSGLGLALVRHIVKAHRGHVRVESEPGRGSTFTIYLPMAENLSDRTETQNPTSRLDNDSSLELGFKH
ncbi:MAG TPA: HAMP domain-containing sensor histidine kinase [Pyrinomonadaceae bacterium]|jgi:signal transduction histidine kinase